MHKRAAEIEQKQRKVCALACQCAAAAGAFAAVLILAVFVPHFMQGKQAAGELPAVRENMLATVFGGNSVLGYIVIATIAFCLGALVTAFCFYLRKWQKKKDEEDL